MPAPMTSATWHALAQSILAGTADMAVLNDAYCAPATSPLPPAFPDEWCILPKTGPDTHGFDLRIRPIGTTVEISISNLSHINSDEHAHLSLDTARALAATLLAAAHAAEAA